MPAPVPRESLARARSEPIHRSMIDRAEMQDRMRAIDLVREIPEAMKPRKIEIGGAAGQLAQAQQTIETKAEDRVEA